MMRPSAPIVRLSQSTPSTPPQPKALMPDPPSIMRRRYAVQAPMAAESKPAPNAAKVELRSWATPPGSGSVAPAIGTGYAHLMAFTSMPLGPGPAFVLFEVPPVAVEGLAGRPAIDPFRGSGLTLPRMKINPSHKPSFMGRRPPVLRNTRGASGAVLCGVRVSLREIRSWRREREPTCDESLL